MIVSPLRPSGPLSLQLLSCPAIVGQSGRKKTPTDRMKTQTLLMIGAYSLAVIGMTDGIGVFSLTPASLLLGLPFTVTGVSSGTLAALGALKLLAATALALSYTGAPLADGGVSSYGGGDGGYGSYGGGGGGGGGYGGGGAYAPSGYGNGGHQMYRRSVDNQIGNVELYFHIINEVDANNCALRLICELEAVKDRSKLQDDERMILALFGPKPKEMPLAAMKTPSGPYHFAAYVGSSSSSNECGKFYNKCPYGATQMMQALRTASTNN